MVKHKRRIRKKKGDHSHDRYRKPKVLFEENFKLNIMF